MTPAPVHHRTSNARPEEPPPEDGVLVGVDLRGIQDYVYSGRRILDAVGRAALVAELTDTSDPVHGVADLIPERCLILRDAGGALTAVLPDRESARHLVSRYTRRLRDRAGELTPVVALVPFGARGPADGGEPEAPDLDTALAVLPARLRRARRYMSALHTPAHGYGVTAICSVGGGPAESVDSSRSEHDRVAADVVRARGIGRRWHREHSRAWLTDAVTASGDPDLALPMEVDRLGRDHGGVSRVAVVHVDVNGLGATLAEYRDRVGDPDRPGSGALAQRSLSTRIVGLTEGLARALVRAVAATVRVDPGEAPYVPPGAARAGPAAGPPDRGGRGRSHRPVRRASGVEHDAVRHGVAGRRPRTDRGPGGPPGGPAPCPGRRARHERTDRGEGRAAPRHLRTHGRCRDRGATGGSAPLPRLRPVRDDVPYGQGRPRGTDRG
ncbi:hypothetical protein B005_5553 [Nocardiopsis alba ATCC BAA-2165]|uniref:Uncharacterized protein n=1 Tax=Nocardiopsis alba (strain ATCC BAA-2165 / BE74) TaxID=1205910 RepID=J7L9U9_NOCAA|nr:hypothetical protein B005_5553 [Nocardiopsis alba ATCC BAA-2165]